MILVTSVACLYPNKNYAYDVDTTIAGLQESFTQSVQNAYTEAVKAVEPNIKVALGGYKGKSGTGIFYKVEADGSYTPIAGCTTPGSHFNANANCDYVGTGEYDEDGNEKKEWKCEGAYESPELSQVDCVYTGSSQPTVSSGGASVKVTMFQKLD